MYPVKSSYANENEFSKELASYLDGQLLYTDSKSDAVKMSTFTERKVPKRKFVPDITVQLSEELCLEHQKLSNPFFIECKLGREHGGHKMTAQRLVMEHLSQFLKYKYKLNSSALKNVEKYGEYDVVVTTPHFLTGKYNVQDFDTGWINPAQLQRTLWHLGLGMLYRTNPKDLEDAKAVNLIEFGFGSARL